MAKIVSTSAYGNDNRYITGAIRQFELTQQFYPGWEYRLYTDDKAKFESIADRANIIEVKQGHGVFWRFLPMFEDENNTVIVRDSDGRITLREQMAVNEWVESDFKFHTFRDHEAHYEFPVIACAFGYKGKLPNKILSIMNEYMLNTNYYTNDQVFLRDVVFPFVKDSTLIHSMYEGWFGETRKRLVNTYDFCGNGYDENDMLLYPSTLAECVGFDLSKVSNEFKFNDGILKI
jgi:hypothetical protein